MMRNKHCYDQSEMNFAIQSKKCKTVKVNAQQRENSSGRNSKKSHLTPENQQARNKNDKAMLNLREI